MHYLSTSPLSTLDQKWQATVSPKVDVDPGAANPERFKLLKNYSKKDYKLSETINKIKHIQAQGMSICLFIGRTPYERLPPDYNEAKESEFWLSGDIFLIPCEKHEVLKEVPTIDNHLWFDFNQQEGLDLIKGLFDKIVIDQSTVKCLENDFAKRFASLLRNSESEMIFENYFMMTLSNLQEDFKFNPSNLLFTVSTSLLEKMMTAKYSEYEKTHSKEEIEQDKKNFLMERSDYSDETDFRYFIAGAPLQSFYPNATALFKEHLSSIYNSVEVYEDGYPYTTNWGGEDYFVVRDPKNLINLPLDNADDGDFDSCTCTIF